MLVYRNGRRIMKSKKMRMEDMSWWKRRGRDAETGEKRCEEES